MTNTNFRWLAAHLLPFALMGCGGGGGGGGESIAVTPPVPSPVPATAISGTVSPQTFLLTLVYTGARPDMLFPPAFNDGRSVPVIIQEMHFTVDTSDTSGLRVSSVSTLPTLLDGIFFTTGSAYAADSTLGQLNTFQTMAPFTSAGSSFYYLFSPNSQVHFDSIDASGPLPTADYTSAGTTVPYVLSVVPPVSTTLNPAGYTYQTFGAVDGPDNSPGGAFATAKPAAQWSYVDAWFSIGIPSIAAAIPLSGTASYTGVLAGTAITAATRDSAIMYSTVQVTVDFAARRASFATSGTTSLSTNAPNNAMAGPSSNLNMTGTLTYLGGQRIFTGPVTSAGGLNGNATCSFYGPGVVAATATKAIGSPPEIGCTFAANNSSVGVIQGALGAN